MNIIKKSAIVAALTMMVVALLPAAAFASTGYSCPDGHVPEDGFMDVPVGNVHEYNIDCLSWWGITSGTGQDSYSPQAEVTREQMASFLVRTYEKVSGSRVQVTRDWFTDDNNSIHENGINKLREIGITFGCNPPDNSRFCPKDSVTREQMASFLIRTYQKATGSRVSASKDYFNDDDNSVHENNINRLAKLGITAGCNPPDNTRYCPKNAVTRAQMATFLMREVGQFVRLGLVDPPPPHPDGQNGNDGDPCEAAESCTGDPTITSASVNDDGNGSISNGDVWTIRFSQPMQTRSDAELQYFTHDGRYEYRRLVECGRELHFDCTWLNSTTLRVEPKTDISSETYPATIKYTNNLVGADGTPLNLAESNDVTID